MIFFFLISIIIGSFAQMYLLVGTVFRMSYVAYWPLVFSIIRNFLENIDSGHYDATNYETHYVLSYHLLINRNRVILQ